MKDSIAVVVCLALAPLAVTAIDRGLYLPKVIMRRLLSVALGALRWG